MPSTPQQAHDVYFNIAMQKGKHPSEHVAKAQVKEKSRGQSYRAWAEALGPDDRVCGPAMEEGG
jgi:hypothetical protein